jgi:GTP cyclohydrolase III
MPIYKVKTQMWISAKTPVEAVENACDAVQQASFGGRDIGLAVADPTSSNEALELLVSKLDIVELVTQQELGLVPAADEPIDL